MSGKTAKKLRKIAGFKISRDPEVKQSAEYKTAKTFYKSLKNNY